MIAICFLFLLLFGKQILSYIEEADFKFKCDLVGVNYVRKTRKRRLEVLVFVGMMVFVPNHLQKYFILLIYLIYKQTYISVNSKLNTLKKELDLQFSIWLRMIEVLLAYNTVPMAIMKSIDTAPSLMKRPLAELSELLRYDPQNRDAYLNFMSHFESLNIERSMHHLYRYAIMGNQDASIQLTNMVEDNAKGLVKVREDMFSNKLNFYSWFGLIPMLLVSIAFLGLMFMVLSHLMKGGWSI